MMIFKNAIAASINITYVTSMVSGAYCHLVRSYCQRKVWHFEI